MTQPEEVTYYPGAGDAESIDEVPADLRIGTEEMYDDGQMVRTWRDPGEVAVWRRGDAEAPGIGEDAPGIDLEDTATQVIVNTIRQLPDGTTTPGETYVVRGGPNAMVAKLKASLAAGKVVGRRVDPDASLPNVVVGQPWLGDGELVAQVGSRIGMPNDDKPVDNPFDRVNARLRSLTAPAEVE